MSIDTSEKVRIKLTLRLFGRQLNQELGEHFFVGCCLQILITTLHCVV